MSLVLHPDNLKVAYRRQPLMSCTAAKPWTLPTMTGLHDSQRGVISPWPSGELIALTNLPDYLEGQNLHIAKVCSVCSLVDWLLMRNLVEMFTFLKNNFYSPSTLWTFLGRLSKQCTLPSRVACLPLGLAITEASPSALHRHLGCSRVQIKTDYLEGQNLHIAKVCSVCF